ncbi:MAG TPA: hypothetical protein VIL96_02810 [Gaiellaceae bacterium]
MGDDKTGTDGDDAGAEARHFPPNWSDAEFPAHLKTTVDDAWKNRPPPSSSGTYDVIIQVEGTNPISGYGVIIRPSG